MSYLPTEIIHKKKSGNTHTPEEINWLIANFVKGSIPKYQMSAWLMAVNFNGMDLSETTIYTNELIKSSSIPADRDGIGSSHKPIMHRRF